MTGLERAVTFIIVFALGVPLGHHIFYLRWCPMWLKFAAVLPLAVVLALAAKWVACFVF